MWWIHRQSYTAVTGSARRGSLRRRLSPLAPSPPVLRCAACGPRCPARHPATWRCCRNVVTCRHCRSGRIAKGHRLPWYTQMFNLLSQQESRKPPTERDRRDEEWHLVPLFEKHPRHWNPISAGDGSLRVASVTLHDCVRRLPTKLTFCTKFSATTLQK